MLKSQVDCIDTPDTVISVSTHDETSNVWYVIYVETEGAQFKLWVTEKQLQDLSSAGQSEIDATEAKRFTTTTSDVTE